MLRRRSPGTLRASRVDLLGDQMRSVWTGFDGRRPLSVDNDRLAETGPLRHRHADGSERLAAETAELELGSERDRYATVGTYRHDLVLQRVSPPHLSLSADEQ